MKDYKRAYRRHMKWVKFIRRAKNWFKDSKDETYNINEAIKGEICTWLRTTGRPCNCAGCTYYKYKREQSQYIKRKIDRDLEL
jgi:hypothetical protein